MEYMAIVSTCLFIHLLVFIPTVVVHGAKKTNLETTPFIVHRDSALSDTMNEAVQVHHLISAMNTTSFEDRANSAWADCLELYEDSIHYLNHSMSLSKTKKDYTNDVHTWLSSSLTNHETCHNGFADFNLSNIYFKFFPSNNISKFLSNSLAINKAVMASKTSRLSSKYSDLSSKNSKERHLLDHELPEWLSASDRKLLEAEAPPIDVVVAQDGSGNFTTISEAVAAKTGIKRFVIYVKKGVYNEYVEIKRSVKNLTLFGDGIDATIVTGSNSNADGFTTFRSATFAARGQGLIVRGMTFENTAGPQKHQAVAMRSSSDLSVFYNCSFKGYQDTLYVHSNRQFYRNCDIYGTVDFIFGNAVAVIQNSNIYVRMPMSKQMNTITAQERSSPDENTGIVLHNCLVTAAPDLKPVQGTFKTYLGRPWKEYSRTIVVKSYLDDLVDPSGWLPWNGDFALQTLYYGEYMNNGSGAGTADRVKWPGYHIITNAEEAERFSVASFLNDNLWLAATGVPYTPGL
ncbi:pectinesterase-like [Apium graveolens]|uniref:pectinesterase-like n=1 Tax=Apium graveolens TaxID=4045 RepID=UPI003D7AE94B